MPTSNLHLAPTVVNLVHTAEPHRTVLDVGPGFGKYGLLLREYLNDPPAVIDAVEVEPSYITPRLEAIYNVVFPMDARDLSYSTYAMYDVVLMVDVIEHLSKADGIALLRQIRGRVVVSTPATFFANDTALPESETHRSLWGLSDFVTAGRTIEVDASEQGAVLVLLAPLAS